jgi:hypothetical protein
MNSPADIRANGRVWRFAMATWLFIGAIFAIVLSLAFLYSRCRKVLSHEEHVPPHDEERRLADVVAKDAARAVDAKMAIFQSKYPV